MNTREEDSLQDPKMLLPDQWTPVSTEPTADPPGPHPVRRLHHVAGDTGCDQVVGAHQAGEAGTHHDDVAHPSPGLRLVGQVHR